MFLVGHLAVTYSGTEFHAMPSLESGGPHPAGIGLCLHFGILLSAWHLNAFRAAMLQSKQGPKPETELSRLLATCLAWIVRV